jgi:hypothetical protein
MCTLMAFSFLMHSYVPFVFKYSLPFNKCIGLAYEACKTGWDILPNPPAPFHLTGAMITVPLHLFALAINQYVGILHRARGLSARQAYMLCIFLWLTPAAILHTHFSTVENMAYRSTNCDNLAFFARRK